MFREWGSLVHAISESHDPFFVSKKWFDKDRDTSATRKRPIGYVRAHNSMTLRSRDEQNFLETRLHSVNNGLFFPPKTDRTVLV